MPAKSAHVLWWVIKTFLHPCEVLGTSRFLLLLQSPFHKWGPEKLSFLSRVTELTTGVGLLGPQPARICTVCPESQGYTSSENLFQALSLLRTSAYAVLSAKIALPHILPDCSPLRFQLKYHLARLSLMVVSLQIKHVLLFSTPHCFPS